MPLNKKIKSNYILVLCIGDNNLHICGDILWYKIGNLFSQHMEKRFPVSYFDEN